MTDFFAGGDFALKQKEFVLFTGNANPKLAKRVARELGVRLGKAVVSRFSDQEIMVKIQERVKGKETFIVQPASFPQNDNLMELFIMAHALKRAKARKVTAIVPWYAYGRQDKSFIEGDPITAKLIAELMQASGIDRLVTVHLHSHKIKNYFKIPVYDLYPEKLFVDHIKEKKLQNFVVVAPDQGVIKETKSLARKLGVPAAFIRKFRPKENVAKVRKLKGRVKGKNCVIWDDMVDTAGTIKADVEALKEHGAKKIYVLATHAPLSGPGVTRIEKAPIKELFVTDSIPLWGKKIRKIRVVSIAPMLAESIRRIMEKKSLRDLVFT